MDRKTFLKNSLLGVVGAALFNNPSKEKSFTKSNYTTILNCTIAGLPYYKGSSVLNFMKTGDTLLLKREPNNIYDEDAIEIFYAETKLGYIPRTNNEVVANIMDNGINVICQLEEIYSLSPVHNEVWIKLFIKK